MRLAIISDIHSNYEALALVLSELKHASIDAYLFLGDYITDGYQDREVLQAVRDTGTHVISGNRDVIPNPRNLDEVTLNLKPKQWTYDLLEQSDIDYLSQLSHHKFIRYGSFNILMIHGHVELADELSDEALDALIELGDFDICLVGHTHQQFNFVYRNRRFINPGSAGLPSDGPAYKYAILEIDTEVQVALCSIDVLPSFDRIQTNYRASDYYQQNTIWGTMVLDAIETGTHTQAFMFSLLKKIQQEDPKLSFADAWVFAFERYQLEKEHIMMTRFGYSAIKSGD